MLYLSITSITSLFLESETKKLKSKLHNRYDFNLTPLPSFIPVPTVNIIGQNTVIFKNYFDRFICEATFKVQGTKIILSLNMDSLMDGYMEISQSPIITVLETEHHKKITTSNTNIIAYSNILKKTQRKIQVTFFLSDLFVQLGNTRLVAVPSTYQSLRFSDKLTIGKPSTQSNGPTPTPTPFVPAPQPDKEAEINALKLEIEQLKEMFRNQQLHPPRPNTPNGGVITNKEEELRKQREAAALKKQQEEEELKRKQAEDCEKMIELIQNLDRELTRCTTLERLEEITVEVKTASDHVISQKIDIPQEYVTRLRRFQADIKKKEQAIKNIP